jgi:hypothetical protein
MPLCYFGQAHYARDERAIDLLSGHFPANTGAGLRDRWLFFEASEKRLIWKPNFGWFLGDWAVFQGTYATTRPKSRSTINGAFAKNERGRVP